MIEQFWLFHCGWLNVPKSAFIKDGGLKLIKLPMMAAVAVHSKLGPVVIDTPYGHEGPANMGAVMGGLARLTSMKFREEWSIIPRLEQLGLRPASVQHILMTHLHYDHTGGMKALSHATFHIARKEWDYALSLDPKKALFSGYALTDFRAINSGIELKDFRETTTLECGIDLFDDGSIEMIPLPGHTPGHVGFRLTLTDGRRVFHVGDAAFTISQITEGHDLGFFPQRVASDYPQAVETLHALRQYHLKYPEDILISSHDIPLGSQCLEHPIALHET